MTDLRASTLAHVRLVLTQILSLKEQATHNLDTIARDLVDQNLNVGKMGTTELAAFIAPHEYSAAPADGLAEARKTLRNAAWQRSIARDLVMTKLTMEQCRTHDIDGIVADLLVWESPQDWEFTGTEWAAFIAPHEYDENGLTDAALAKALERSRSGWVAVIRRPGTEDVQTLNLKRGGDDATPESIEATLREFVNFPEGTSITILPLVG